MVGVQVAAAHAGAQDAHDRVGGLLDDRVGGVLDTDVAGSYMKVARMGQLAFSLRGILMPAALTGAAQGGQGGRGRAAPGVRER